MTTAQSIESIRIRFMEKLAKLTKPEQAQPRANLRACAEQSLINAGLTREGAQHTIQLWNRAHLEALEGAARLEAIRENFAANVAGKSDDTQRTDARDIAQRQLQEAGYTPHDAHELAHEWFRQDYEARQRAAFARQHAERAPTSQRAAKRHAIAQADAELNNAACMTYTEQGAALADSQRRHAQDVAELRAKVAELADHVDQYRSQRDQQGARAVAAENAAALAAMQCDELRALENRQAARSADLALTLINAIEGAGFAVAGPTDHRAAEHGEPQWVCNARAALANSY